MRVSLFMALHFCALNARACITSAVALAKCVHEALRRVAKRCVPIACTHNVATLRAKRSVHVPDALVREKAARIVCRVAPHLKRRPLFCVKKLLECETNTTRCVLRASFVVPTRTFVLNRAVKRLCAHIKRVLSLR
jgi:hypothetical protein